MDKPEEYEQERIPSVYEMLADVHRFTSGELCLGDGERILQLFFIKDKIQILTYNAIWEYEPLDGMIRVLSFV